MGHEPSRASATWVRVTVTGMALACCLAIFVAGISEWSGAWRAPDFWTSFQTTVFSPAIYSFVVPIFAYQVIYRWNSRLYMLRRLLELCCLAMLASQTAVWTNDPLRLNLSSQWHVAWLIGLAALLIVAGRLVWFIHAEKRQLAGHV